MKTVLCFGDSNTHGQIPGKDGGRYEKEIRWPGVLKSMLGDSFDVIEEGLGGRTTVFEDPIEEDKLSLIHIFHALHADADALRDAMKNSGISNGTQNVIRP